MPLKAQYMNTAVIGLTGCLFLVQMTQRAISSSLDIITFEIASAVLISLQLFIGVNDEPTDKYLSIQRPH